LNLEPTEPADPWYRDGLAFECTRCGACCTGAPGYVWVSVSEIETLARFRDQTVEAFSSRFIRRVGNRFSLIERPGGDCIFWDRQLGCTVYDARPAQCRSWPFWPENLESPSQWAQVQQSCPGAGKGRIHSAQEILSALKKTPS
jgi:Fe-S-cluster containining protein